MTALGADHNYTVGCRSQLPLSQNIISGLRLCLQQQLERYSVHLAHDLIAHLSTSYTFFAVELRSTPLPDTLLTTRFFSLMSTTGTGAVASSDITRFFLSDGPMLRSEPYCSRFPPLWDSDASFSMTSLAIVETTHIHSYIYQKPPSSHSVHFFVSVNHLSVQSSWTSYSRCFNHPCRTTESTELHKY